MKRLTTLVLAVLLSGFNTVKAMEEGTVAKATECTKPGGFRFSVQRDPNEGPYDFLDKYNP